MGTTVTMRPDQARPLIDLLIEHGYEAYWEGHGACGGNDPAYVTEANPSGHWHGGDVRIRNLTEKQIAKLTRTRQ